MVMWTSPDPKFLGLLVLFLCHHLLFCWYPHVNMSQSFSTNPQNYLILRVNCWTCQLRACVGKVILLNPPKSEYICSQAAAPRKKHPQFFWVTHTFITSTWAHFLHQGLSTGLVNVYWSEASEISPFLNLGIFGDKKSYHKSCSEAWVRQHNLASSRDHDFDGFMRWNQGSTWTRKYTLKNDFAGTVPCFESISI